MSLDNIQLPAATVGQLFKKSLVDLKIKQAPAPGQTSSGPAVLGKNNAGVLIIVNCPDTPFLPDTELNFLLGILGACKLNMDDVGIINIHHHAGLDYKKITATLKAEKLFLFGCDAASLELPLAFPHYQAQAYNHQLYLTAPSLSDLQHDKAEKTKLWNSLKQIFSI